MLKTKTKSVCLVLQDRLLGSIAETALCAIAAISSLKGLRNPPSLDELVLVLAGGELKGWRKAKSLERQNLEKKSKVG